MIKNPPSTKADEIKKNKKRILSNLVVADRLAPCLHVGDVVDGGGGVLLCVLLVPIHSRVEVRNRRNLTEMSMTMRRELKVEMLVPMVTMRELKVGMLVTMR